MTTRITLDQQIEELQRERRMRDEVYPRLVRSGKKRQSEVDYINERLDAAIQSLQ